MVENRFSLVARLQVLFVFTFAAAGGRQLSAEILVDQLLLRAERSIQQEDSDAALEVIWEILVLQEEHGIELPAEFYFRRAQATFAAATLESAKESVTSYLTAAGKDGEFYDDALVLGAVQLAYQEGSDPSGAALKHNSLGLRRAEGSRWRWLARPARGSARFAKPRE